MVVVVGGGHLQQRVRNETNTPAQFKKQYIPRANSGRVDNFDEEILPSQGEWFLIRVFDGRIVGFRKLVFDELHRQ